MATAADRSFQTSRMGRMVPVRSYCEAPGEKIPDAIVVLFSTRSLGSVGANKGTK